MISAIKRIRWYLWILIILAVGYVGVSVYFMEHFFPGTTINGANADLYTVKQANELLLPHGIQIPYEKSVPSVAEDALSSFQWFHFIVLPS